MSNSVRSWGVVEKCKISQCVLSDYLQGAHVVVIGFISPICSDLLGKVFVTEIAIGGSH